MSDQSDGINGIAAILTLVLMLEADEGFLRQFSQSVSIHFQLGNNIIFVDKETMITRKHDFFVTDEVVIKLGEYLMLEDFIGPQ